MLESCFDLLEKATQKEILPAPFGEARDDGDHRLELAHFPVKYYGLALPDAVNSVTPNHQARKDVCSHLISALKDETTFETADHAMLDPNEPTAPERWSRPRHQQTYLKREQNVSNRKLQ